MEPDFDPYGCGALLSVVVLLVLLALVLAIAVRVLLVG